MATLTKRGKAVVTGCAMTFDVVLYPEPQSAKATHQFDLETIKDPLGQDESWVAKNEHIDGDIMLKLIDKTGGATGFVHAKAGAAFFAPLAVITISACDVAMWNTTWVVQPGSDIGLKNDAVGDFTLKLRQYVDATQNTLSATTPS